MTTLFNRAYYTLKPFIPRRVSLAVRRRWAAYQRSTHSAVWPIDERAGAAPPGWPGWPGGKRFALVLTHDVEGPKGLERCERLMEIEARYGFRSSFNFIPEEDYRVPDSLRHKLHQAGFEVGVHGLGHDGKLYFSKPGFPAKAARIRHYLDLWNAAGFRSPLMQHNLAWLHQLGAEYDSSTFDTDPFEPEPDGVATIFPFWVPGPEGSGFVELPYTLVQDSTLFGVLREPGIDIWKQKLDWIAARGGMALLNTHPDYMSFEGAPAWDEFPVSHYEDFLKYVRERYGGAVWSALPRDVARYYTAALPAGNRNSRRKICMVTHSNYASDNRVRRYAETLARRGDQVDVISISTGDTPLGEDEINGVRVFRIQHRLHDERGKWTYAWRLTRFFISSSSFLTRRHRDVRYDLIHVHNIPDFIVFAAWYPKWTGVKVILDIHDIVPELFANKFKSRAGALYVRFLKLVEKASAAFADHVIIANHLWYDKLTARAAPPQKCTVFLNHVDSAIFHRRTRTRDDSRFILLFHGTFQWHQGLEIAVQALAHVREKAPNAELHLYGGGGGAGATAQLSKLADSLGLNGSVKFCGTVPLHEIPQVIANADLGIVPKRADSFGNEACSTKIMEFMSQGVPVVVSRTKIDTYYHNDQNVRFFTSGDSQAMAEAILDVIENPALRASLIDAGLKYVEQNSWDKKKNEYLALVDSLTTETFDNLRGSVSKSPTQPHVCIIVENLPVPADRRVWREAKALTAAGYRVSVICPKGQGFDQSQQTLEGVEIYRHPTREGDGLVGHLGEYGWSLLMEFWLALKVYRQDRFQILQACNPPDTIFLIALFFKLFGVRFIYDQHDPVPELYQAKFNSKGLIHRIVCFAERLTFRAADVAIATNQSCREIALTRGRVPPHRSFIVRGCPDLKDFPPQPARQDLKEGHDHLVLYVGYMGAQDGIDLLLDSIQHLVKQRGLTNTLFVLIGQGTEVPHLKAVVSERNLESSVKFTGALYGDDLRAYLATADVGVAPDPQNTFNDKLTMLKILEYMTYSMPVVLYDLAEGRNTAGAAALYAQNNDPIDFADKVLTLLESESLRRELGAIGRQRIQESLNWDVEKQSLLRAYEAAMEAGK